MIVNLVAFGFWLATYALAQPPLPLWPGPTTTGTLLQITPQTGLITRITGRSQTVDGRQYGVFLGIPYAQPPVGQLRFAEPQPLVTSFINASGDFRSVCPQERMGPPGQTAPGIDGDEDCLYLNVFTPAATQQQLSSAFYPVMFWIHGGAFKMGSGKFDTEKVLRNLVSKDVVLVSINYRLGALGFWSTLTPTVRGNLGFMDQNMALQWVRANIRLFGGDPSRVTIVGESAGGASISAQTLSPLSQGLFNQAIMMSGSMYGNWARTDDRPLRGLLQTFEESVGCPQRRQQQSSSQFPDQALVQCMQAVSVDKLVLTDATSTTGGASFWTGRVDGKFFPVDIPELGKRRPPLTSMIGSTKDEFAAMTMMDVFFNKTKLVTTPAQIVNESIPRTKGDATISPEVFRNIELVRKAAAVQYVELAKSNVSGNPDVYWFSKDNQMKSAINFFAPPYRDASQYAANGATVYLYSIDYDYFAIPQLNWKGATHGGELAFLFGASFPNDPIPNPFNAQMTETMTTLWTNFVKFGNPTPQGSYVVWRPMANATATNYLSINPPTIAMKDGYRSSDVNFWNVIVPQIEANGRQVCASGVRLPSADADFYRLFCTVF